MSLKDEVKSIIGNRRRFLLLRICDIDTETARKLCNIKKGTYNSWLQDEKFVALYRRRDEFSGESKQEAIRLLRRDNQLNAVLLEEKILLKMKAEIESGEYSLIRTNLARDVYSKLISDLDYQPQALSLSWEQRLGQLFLPQQEQVQEQLEGAKIIEGQLIEAVSS